MERSEATENEAFLDQFDRPGAIIANIVAHIVAVVPISLYVMAAPSLMKTFEVGPSSFGAMISLGMIAASATALVVGSNAYRLDLRRTSMLGILFHIAGYLIAFMADVFTGIMVARVVSSIGDALLLSSANALLSRSRNNTRFWALSAVASGLGSSIGTFALGRTLDNFGPDVFFGGMIVAGLVTLPMLLLFPRYTMPEAERGKRPGNFVERLFVSLGSARGLAILTGAMLLGLGNSALFSFSAVIGTQTGLTTSQIGSVQSISYIVVTCVNAGIAVVATKFGKAKPVLVIATVFAVSAITLGSPGSFTAYAFALICMAAAFRSTNPYVYSISARQDPAGGVVASLVVFVGIGNAIGPILTPWMLGDSNDYTYVGYASAAIVATGLSILAFISFGHEREDREKGTPQQSAPSAH